MFEEEVRKEKSRNWVILIKTLRRRLVYSIVVYITNSRIVIVADYPLQIKGKLKEETRIFFTC